MIIRAKYHGTCRKCERHIVPGTWISWSRTEGVSHADPCVPASGLATATVERVEAAQEQAAVQIDASPIVAFLQAARDRGLKFPKACFLAPGSHKVGTDPILAGSAPSELMLYVAGERSKAPGSIQVKVDGRWVGRVEPSGKVVGHELVERADLQATLLAIAADPAEAAKKYGALVGRCSFCGLGLTDEGSIEVGYGPVCAKRWGLPHKPRGSKVLSVPVEVAVAMHCA